MTRREQVAEERYRAYAEGRHDGSGYHLPTWKNGLDDDVKAEWMADPATDRILALLGQGNPVAYHMKFRKTGYDFVTVNPRRSNEKWEVTPLFAHAPEPSLREAATKFVSEHDQYVDGTSNDHHLEAAFMDLRAALKGEADG